MRAVVSDSWQIRRMQEADTSATGNHRHGIGQSLLNACLNVARTLGFERCYAETVKPCASRRRYYAMVRRAGREIGCIVGVADALVLEGGRPEFVS